MTVIIYILFLATAFNVLLGIIVLRASPKNPVNISFFAVCLLFGMWALLNYFLQTNPGIQVLRLIYALAPFLVTTAMLWTRILKSPKLGPVFSAIILGIYGINLLMLFLTVNTSRVIASVHNASDYQTGDLFFIYVFYLCALFLSLIIFMITVYQTSEQSVKTQLRFIMVGFFTMIAVGFVVSVLLPLVFGYTKLNFLDSPSSMIFVFLSSQAVLKYKMLNTKVVATELFIGIFWLMLLVKIILEGNITNQGIDIIIFLAAIILGSLLIKTALHEISQREQLENLTKQLESANKRLQEA